MKNMFMFSWKRVGLVALALFVSAPMLQAQHRDGGRPGAPEHPVAPMARPESARRPEPVQRQSEHRAEVQRQVERIQHGSIRHADAPIIRHEREVPVIRDQRNHFDMHRRVDVDIDRRNHFWGGFHFGTIVRSLPIGFQTIVVNGAPYNYYNGVYYQPGPSGYVEVYPPVGAAVIQPPEGSIPISAGNQTYYYAGGAFYVQQGDQFVVAPTPIGVVVPELPPGAVQVVVNGQIAYQFNGIYYQPVFVNGVTAYQTFLP